MRESARAQQAWADYLAMGDGRSLEALVNRYQTVKADGGSAPTTRLPTLADWSRHHDWQGRLKRLAQEQSDRIAAEMEVRRREIMGAGLALDFERVAVLGRLATRLLDELERADDNRLWVDDVKQIGGGDRAERVPIERFNQGEVAELRGLLDDLAKETGGRLKKVDVTSGGKTIKGYIGVDPEDV